MGNGKQNVEIKVTYARDHRVVHADSALAGPTPRGEFRIEFATMLPPPIVKSVAELGADGSIVSQKLESESGSLLMERQVTVVMSRSAAKTVSDLLVALLKDNG